MSCLQEGALIKLSKSQQKTTGHRPKPRVEEEVYSTSFLPGECVTPEDVEKGGSDKRTIVNGNVVSCVSTQHGCLCTQLSVEVDGAADAFSSFQVLYHLRLLLQQLCKVTLCVDFFMNFFTKHV